MDSAPMHTAACPQTGNLCMRSTQSLTNSLNRARDNGRRIHTNLSPGNYLEHHNHYKVLCKLRRRTNYHRSHSMDTVEVFLPSHRAHPPSHRLRPSRRLRPQCTNRVTLSWRRFRSLNPGWHYRRSWRYSGPHLYTYHVTPFRSRYHSLNPHHMSP